MYPYTTKSGTDILINDRQNEFNDNKLSLCENSCDLIEYEQNTKKVVCECKIKVNPMKVSNMNNQDLSYNFNSIDQSQNMVTMKCVYTLFTKEGLISNTGNYIFLFIILLFFISEILFMKCGYNLIENKINEVVEIRKENNKIISKINETNGVKKEVKIKINKEKKIKKKTRNKIKRNNISKSLTKSNLNNNNKSLTILSTKETQNSNIEFNDYELNIMEYKTALKYDKRTYFQYYFSLIKIKHPLLFLFLTNNDYNSIIIKIDLFFLSFSIYYFVNALFFNEKIIHQIYEDQGIYNFIYLIPFVIYSFIIF